MLLLNGVPQAAWQYQIPFVPRMPRPARAVFLHGFFSAAMTYFSTTEKHILLLKITM